MAQVTISSESLDQLFSAACSFYLLQANSGGFASEEQKQQAIAVLREACKALGRDEKSNVNVWLVLMREQP